MQRLVETLGRRLFRPKQITIHTACNNDFGNKKNMHACMHICAHVCGGVEKDPKGGEDPKATGGVGGGPWRLKSTYPNKYRPPPTLERRGHFFMGRRPSPRTCKCGPKCGRDIFRIEVFFSFFSIQRVLCHQCNKSMRQCTTTFHETVRLLRT